MGEQRKREQEKVKLDSDQMGPYPDLQPALPAHFVRPSRTTRLLNPVLVLITVVLVAVMSLVGLCVAIAVFLSSGPRTGSTDAAQGFAIVAAIMSIGYVTLHGVAAKYNEPVGVTRPPELRLHAACFILARLSLVGWLMEFIAACVVVSKPSACLSGSSTCHIMLADVVASLVAFMAMGIVLTALEACKFPFEIPDIFHASRRLTYRVSAFADDLLERSVSRTPSFRESGEKGKERSPASSVDEKPLPRPPLVVSDASPERPVTPLLPMARPKRSESRSTVKGWGEEWTHLVKDMKGGSSDLGESGTKHSLDSAISLTYDSSSGYVSSSERSSHTRMSSYASTYRNSVIGSGTYVTASRRSGVDMNSYTSGPRRAPVARRPRPRVVTPSSSISNISRRSPLSSMRSAEFPEMVVRPDLRYYPPRFSSQHEWIPSRSSSISTLMPIADVQRLRRSSMTFPETMRVRGPSKTLPPLPRPMSPRPPSSRGGPLRRRTADIKVPGAFAERKPSFDIEQSLDDHMRMIEVEAVVTRRQSSRGNPGFAPSTSQVLKPVSQNRIRRGEKIGKRASLIRSNLELREQQLVKQSISAIDKQPPTTRSNPELRGPDQNSKLTPSSGAEKIYPSVPAKPDSSRPGKFMFAHRGHTTVTSEARPVTAQPTGAVKVESEVKVLRPLSLGDISSSLGDLFQ
ncbi:uncharacterized protein PAC_06404 [Phialocephala subalpina]|uniref:Uncharacterized protein n=1 Tax=Phialocephala subalpina TaxID=576137 RepID=A0A1L7WUQ9_9HELO|nr:uncharacterized protein PAC_06404 [Phialocephala subalpina]